jgi:SnoaL-like domain
MAITPSVEQFLHAIESATIPACDVWSADATLDATVPNWRLHADGPDAIRAEYARWFADPGHFDELQHYAVGGADAAAGGGASDLIEYTLSWSENGVPYAAHHMHLLTVRDGLIAADTVMCGGRWPASLLAEMEAADA